MYAQHILCKHKDTSLVLWNFFGCLRGFPKAEEPRAQCPESPAASVPPAWSELGELSRALENFESAIRQVEARLEGSAEADRACLEDATQALGPEK